MSGNRSRYQLIIDEISEERMQINARFGEQNHDCYRWLAILGEEYGECCEAALQYEFDKKIVEEEFGKLAITRFREELVQVAAVAIATIECLDRRGRDSRTPVTFPYVPKQEITRV